MSKKVNELTALTTAQVDDNTKLWPVGVASTGLLNSCTTAQMKLTFATQKVKYVATGAEGSTITIAALAGKEILLIMRESGPLFEVVSSPDPAEFVWDSTNITLGAAVGGAGERFLILYKNA
mgnify:CR=1 FL=1